MRDAAQPISPKNTNQIERKKTWLDKMDEWLAACLTPEANDKSPNFSEKIYELETQEFDARTAIEQEFQSTQPQQPKGEPSMSRKLRDGHTGDCRAYNSRAFFASPAPIGEFIQKQDAGLEARKFVKIAQQVTFETNEAKERTALETECMKELTAAQQELLPKMKTEQEQIKQEQIKQDAEWINVSSTVSSTVSGIFKPQAKQQPAAAQPPAQEAKGWLNWLGFGK